MALRPGLTTGLPCSEKLNCLLNKWCTFARLSNQFAGKGACDVNWRRSGHEMVMRMNDVANSPHSSDDGGATGATSERRLTVVPVAPSCLTRFTPNSL